VTADRKLRRSPEDGPSREGTAVTGDRKLRRSPLNGLTRTGAVPVAEVPFLAQLDLRVEPSAAPGLELPPTGGTTIIDADVSVLGLGPDEWLVVGPPGAESRLTALLETAAADGSASVVDVSAQRTTVAVSGPHVRDLLALGCSLDLHPRVFAAGACAQTTLAHTPVVVWRRDSAFWILVRASFAAHLAAWLDDASLEFTAGD
jgi:sarcosine oxidase subunit gamma